MSRTRGRLFTIGLVLGACGTIVTAASEDLLPRNSDYDYEPPAPGSYTLPTIKTATDGVLLDSSGKAINLRDLTHGRITVLGFIYTRCAAPKGCPYATNVFDQLHSLSAKDKALTLNMRLVSVSFDPVQDPPQHIPEYSEWMLEKKSGCNYLFLTVRSLMERDP